MGKENAGEKASLLLPNTLNIDINTLDLFIILALIPNEKAPVDQKPQSKNDSKSDQLGLVSITFVILHLDI